MANPRAPRRQSGRQRRANDRYPFLLSRPIFWIAILFAALSVLRAVTA